MMFSNVFYSSEIFFVTRKKIARALNSSLSGQFIYLSRARTNEFWLEAIFMGSLLNIRRTGNWSLVFMGFTRNSLQESHACLGEYVIKC